MGIDLCDYFLFMMNSGEKVQEKFWYISAAHHRLGLQPYHLRPKKFPFTDYRQTTVPQDSNEPTNSATGFFFLTVSNNIAVCNNKMYFAD